MGLVRTTSWKPFWLATQRDPQNDWVAKSCELWRIRTVPTHSLCDPEGPSRLHLSGPEWNHSYSWLLSKENDLEMKLTWQLGRLRGAWSDRDTNDIFAHCSLIFYFLGLKFSNFVCPSELHPLIWFFLKNSFWKKKNIRKTTKNALAPSIFIVWSIVLKLGTPLLHIQAQNTLLQNF